MDTTVNQPARTAAEELAESQRRYDETRKQIAADQADIASAAVALAFQLGRMQGRAEMVAEHIAQMAAKAGQP